MSVKEIMKKNKKMIRVAKSERPYLPRVPSGVFIFDALTGGGIPLWKVSIFHGIKSSGKTTQGLRIIGNFLELYPDKYVVYVDFENSFDKSWAVNFIEEDSLERVLVVSPDYGEEGVDLAVQMSKEEEVGMLFVDSLAMIIPTADATNSAMDDTMGTQAKLVNKLIRKTVPIVSNAYKNDRVFTCLFVNQLTTKYGASAFTSPYKKPGGILQDFVNSLDIRFYFIKYVMQKGIPTAGIYQIKIEKSKVRGALQHAQGEFKMSLVSNGKDVRVGQPLDSETILSYAKRTNVVKRDGNKWVYNENVFKNQAELLSKMEEDSVFLYSLGDAVLKHIYENGLYGGTDEDD